MTVHGGSVTVLQMQVRDSLAVLLRVVVANNSARHSTNGPGSRVYTSLILALKDVAPHCGLRGEHRCVPQRAQLILRLRGRCRTSDRLLDRGTLQYARE